MGFGSKGTGGSGCKVYSLAHQEVFVTGSGGGFRVSVIYCFLRWWEYLQTARVIFMDLGCRLGSQGVLLRTFGICLSIWFGCRV